ALDLQRERPFLRSRARAQHALGIRRRGRTGGIFPGAGNGKRRTWILRLDVARLGATGGGFPEACRSHRPEGRPMKSQLDHPKLFSFEFFPPKSPEGIE